MATLLESLHTALEMERQGHRFYIEAATVAEGPVAKSVLMALADDEEAHESIISRYYEVMEKHQDWPAIDGSEAGLSDTVREIVDVTIGSINADTAPVDVYQAAREMEVQSLDFYRRQRDSAQDRRVSEFFGFLACVEEAHVEALDAVLIASGRKTRVAV